MNVSIYKQLTGEVARKVYQNGKDELHFELKNGKHYMFFHDQDCCESVEIDDVCGDLNDLIESEILVAEECCFKDVNPDGKLNDYQDSFTWTFYKFQTIKGSVTVKWYGESNGYYSESVNFKEVNVLD